MNDTLSPIGVFDSGIGGISVLRALYQRMPNERFLYYGDNARAPYGTKARETILEYSKQILQLLRDRGAKAVVIACNTATAAAAEQLRLEHPCFPIVGVEPAIRPAALFKEHPRVLIMATPMTLHLEKFLTLEKELSLHADFQTLPCPGLVEYIERGALTDDRTRQFLKELLKEHLQNPPDAVVLGCTHYPFVLPLLKELFPEKTLFFDGAKGTARQLERRLIQEGLRSQSPEPAAVEFLTSSKDPSTISLMKRFFES